MHEHETDPRLLEQLRVELAERPLERASECPTWRVYTDWLLERGDPFGEWLALALDPDSVLGLRRLVEDRTRPLAGTSLVDLIRNERGWCYWLGPFALATVQPSFSASTLASTLGRHAALLLPQRAWVGQDWMAAPLQRVFGHAVLVSVDDPRMLEPIAAALCEAARTRPPFEDVLLARPGEPMPTLLPPLLAPNPGPTSDPDELAQIHAQAWEQSMTRALLSATGVLCCADLEDLRRHAADWDRLARLGSCVILGPAAVLASWPHPRRH